MFRLLSNVFLIVLGLAGVEGFAWWWMHPDPAGINQPVLVYHPTRSGGITHPASGMETTRVPQTNDKSPITEYSSQPSISSTTPLPAVVEKALPSLRCTTGTAARIDFDNGTTIHLAFFEWDLTDSTSVLEAFKHLPEECMGSIGMKLIEHRPPREFRIDGESMGFDHTVFRDRVGVIVHAFKGTWVSGMNTLLVSGFRGGADQWTQIRWKAGLKRFHPAYARVVQGAIRGISSPDLAWEEFKRTMLVDLKMESR